MIAHESHTLSGRLSSKGFASSASCVCQRFTGDQDPIVAENIIHQMSALLRIPLEGSVISWIAVITRSGNPRKGVLRADNWGKFRARRCFSQVGTTMDGAKHVSASPVASVADSL